MNEQCLCDNSSDTYSEDKKEEDVTLDGTASNKIFLNFTREYRHPAKDRYNQEKVKELFKHLKERIDLQEIKVSGRLDSRVKAKEFKKEKGKLATTMPDGKIKEGNVENDEDNDDDDDDDDDEDVDDVDEDEDNDDSTTKNGVGWYSDEGSSPKCGGQRFTMSRDFWYRKLNTLKARKLDEAALETEDMPPDDKFNIPKCIKHIRNQKVYADQVPQKKEEMFAEITKFEKDVAHPVEKCLKTNFINVYDNHEYFRKDSQF